MPQLIKIIAKSAVFGNFKCPYHANVIKTFEIMSKTTGKASLNAVFIIQNILKQIILLVIQFYVQKEL